MPHSLVFNLLPQSDIQVGYLAGKHHHALFLNLVSSVDRNLGDRFHYSTADKVLLLIDYRCEFDILPGLKPQGFLNITI